MKAIVLSCDKYRPVLHHMLLTYEALWPDNNITWRIPWNEEYPTDIVDHFGDKVDPIQTSSEFIKTINTLLEGIPDDEWIFWSMDDTYLEHLDVDKANRTYEFVQSITDPKTVGFSFTHLKVHETTSNPDTISYQDLTYVKLSQTCQWLPQFWRAKILRALFNSIEEPKTQAKDMDHMLHRGNPVWQHFKQFDFYMLNEKTAAFGECMWRGKITGNCAESFAKFNLKVPEKFLPSLISRIYK